MKPTPALTRRLRVWPTTLSQAKSELASALEDDDTTDAQILERVESAIAAHGRAGTPGRPAPDPDPKPPWRPSSAADSWVCVPRACAPASVTSTVTARTPTAEVEVWKAVVPPPVAAPTAAAPPKARGWNRGGRKRG